MAKKDKKAKELIQSEEIATMGMGLPEKGGKK